MENLVSNDMCAVNVITVTSLRKRAMSNVHSIFYFYIWALSRVAITVSSFFVTLRFKRILKIVITSAVIGILSIIQ